MMTSRIKKNKKKIKNLTAWIPIRKVAEGTANAGPDQ